MAKKQAKSNFNGYTKDVLKRFTDPKFFGEIKDADGVGVVGNPQCGDIMKIYLKIKDKKIKDIKFQTFGCVSAIASSDALCEIAKGKTIVEAKKIDNKKILKKLDGLPTIKVHCSVLGSAGLKKALLDYEMRQGKKVSKKELERLDKEAEEEHH